MLSRSEMSVIAEDADWISVNSSNVAAIAYMEEIDYLLVRFDSGAVYYYEHTGPGLFQEFMLAPSKGKFVWDVLRGANGIRPIHKGTLDTMFNYDHL